MIIDNDEAKNEYLDYINEDKPSYAKIIGNTIETPDFTVEVESEYSDLLDYVRNRYESKYSNPLIFGKNTKEGIVSIEVNGNNLELFYNNGDIEVISAKFWICAAKPLDRKFKKLKGNSHYKYIRTFSDREEYNKMRGIYRKQDIYVVYDDVEAQMISKGLTLFKGLKLQDVSVLSFDIEGAGLARHKDSKVFVITNTYRVNGNTETKQFREDNYSDMGEMIEDWCNWVREIDPTIITGHNLFGYDLDYMNHVASLYGKKLLLGRDGSEAKFNKKPKNYRVDGSQTWEYKNCKIYGRHVIDGMFLAVKYDIGRNFPSWGLKPIAEHLGIVAEDRQFYDASKIGTNWYDLVEREKIVQYCIDDGNDSLGLYDIMVPSFFYMCQSIPKSFQTIINSASGAWLNTIMVRSYLQDFHSVPKANEPQKVSGGISFGRPGVHDNVFKIDIKSMYPSIMREWQVNSPSKDPNNNFFKMVEHFTIKRFEQKGEYKKTGDKYYDDLQASSKIFINSCYGMMGTSGLNFNSFENADYVTGMGRQIIRETMKWATGEDIGYWWEGYDFEKDRKYEGKVTVDLSNHHNFVMVNADTDSISFRKRDGSEFSQEETENLIEEINELLPTLIEYEDDGYFDRVVVVKAKNYVLKSGDKIKYKGSSLTDTKKEPALREMLREIIEESLIYEKTPYISIYNKYLKEVKDIKDINRWATKKSITEKLLESERANETKVVDALGDKPFQIGDKVFLFNKIEGMKQAIVKGEPVFLKKTGEPKMVENAVLRLVEDFDGAYNMWHYVDRVYKTFDILKNVIDMEQLIKYSLRSKRNLLEEL
jgi:DNA polymerase elongation subunit (family B)